MVALDHCGLAVEWHYCIGGQCVTVLLIKFLLLLIDRI